MHVLKCNISKTLKKYGIKKAGEVEYVKRQMLVLFLFCFVVSFGGGGKRYRLGTSITSTNSFIDCNVLTSRDFLLNLCNKPVKTQSRPQIK